MSHSEASTIRPDDDYPVKRSHFVFDIETGAAPHDEVELCCPTIKPSKSL
jgi:hypothetical protein